MKNLRIGLLLMFFVLAGLWLSAAENIIMENNHQLTPKTGQADTVRMTWVLESTPSLQCFSFQGEEGATYKVDWGDGETETITGKDSYYCHSYSKKGAYKVLLYGVIENKK